MTIANLERAHQMALANADAVRDMTLATVADTFANTAAMAENTLAAAISGASMRLVSEQGQAFLVLTVTTASAEAAAELAITAADGALEVALASATATSVTIVAAAESAHGVSITDAGLSLAATGYGAVQGFFGAVSSAAGTFVASIGAAVSNQIGTIGSAVTTVVNTWALGQSQATGDAVKAKVSAGLAKSGADAQAEVAAYGRQVLADLAYQGAIAGADAKLVMQEALGASVFVHTVLPGLAAITGDKARAMVAATGEIVAAINGLQATLQGLTVSATVQGAAAAVRHAVLLTKADMDHLVTVTVAAGKASTDVSLAGVELAAVIGAASVDAFDQTTTALVVHTMQVGLAAVLMTARIGKAATLATHDLGLARIALQGAVGVADVTWATSVANAQSAYDALMGRGQVAAAERLRDPFETYKAKQAQIGGDLRTALAVNDVQRRIAAEQHAMTSGGFMGDWSKEFNYVVGGLQMVGAVVEITIGATFVSASIASGATGIGIPIALITGTLGAFMVGHGLDNLNTGFQTIVTGAPQRTLTSQALDSLTGNEFYSEVADTALGLLSGAAAGKIFRLAAMTDDMGRCLNMMGRMFYGGCFTGDTLVHVTAVADGDTATEHDGHGASTTATATATQCLAIAKVPIGSRVLAINPRPEEFDDSFSEPVQSEWARVSFLIVRNDLSVVEAEFIRPRAWIESVGLVKGARIDLAVPELGIDGLAEVTAVRACPPIAEGEGRVVTGRFVTRDVANVVRITLATGTEIRATDVHPVWSIDREDWVPAGKLEPGELVDTLIGPVAVVTVEPLDRHPAVYNLEVHGEHVYRIAVDGVLVHNAGPGEYLKTANAARPKPINLPSAKGVRIDMDHIVSGHLAGGKRASPMKSLFPEGWTPKDVERAVRSAYKNAKTLSTQGNRVLVSGICDRLRIEMWVNKLTRTIETAYPTGVTP